jgi:hypothetical protein
MNKGDAEMDISKIKLLSYDEVRALYREFLHSQSIAKATINTSYVDTFYLWRKGSKDLFWDTVTSPVFENDAKEALIKVLSENSTGNVNSLVNSYLSHLRRFRLFLASDGTANTSTLKRSNTANRTYRRKKKTEVNVPQPSTEQVELYLAKWNTLENYRLQEIALNKLFFELLSLIIQNIVYLLFPIRVFELTHAVSPKSFFKSFIACVNRILRLCK